MPYAYTFLLTDKPVGHLSASLVATDSYSSLVTYHKTTYHYVIRYSHSTERADDDWFSAYNCEIVAKGIKGPHWLVVDQNLNDELHELDRKETPTKQESVPVKSEPAPVKPESFPEGFSWERYAMAPIYRKGS